MTVTACFYFQEPSILDPSSAVDNVRTILNNMNERMEEFHQRSFQYKTYQKNFKVEVTKFEELEQVHAEIRLKQLLWDSLNDWDGAVDEWLKLPFDDLSKA